MTAPGPKNLITDVGGVLVGNAEDARAWTGVTVVLPAARAVGAVDVRGGAPGTRETDSLDPARLVGAVDAVVLAGGSVYGLEAASAVTAALGAQGRGYRLAGPLVAPIVPSAILFDLANGGDKGWGATPPYAGLGLAALSAAGAEFALGNAGAGYGARAGLYKGGLGSASLVTADGYAVGALVAVNSFGSPVVPGTTTLWAWSFEQGGELGMQVPPTAPIGDLDLPADMKGRPAAQSGSNTTIGIVACNAALTPAEAQRIAIMAQDGYARAIRPIHTAFDGDVIFALATGERALGEPRPAAVSRLGALAADCVARAVGRGVYEADTLGEAVSYRARRSL
ncbi:MAG: P1 family peptidase [Alphaproteobacteria bacterium]|nr:P1 family peptidase [Alphaproteobacteria bacterium]